MKRTAKILLILSLIFSIGSLDRIFTRKLLLIEDRDKPREKLLANKTEEEIKHEIADTSNVFWEKPKESPKGEVWTFDLFTAPTITKENGQYKASLPWVAQLDLKTELQLVRLEKILYPIQYLGFFLSPGKSNQSMILMLSDVEKNDQISAKIGDTVTSHKLEITRFEEKGADGSVSGYPKVYIKDHETQREEILTPVKKYYDHLFRMVLKQSDGSEVNITSQVGKTFSAGNSEYKVLSVDMAQKRVTLEQKIGKDVIQIEIAVAK